MTTKIEIYNGALGKIGVESISSLTEDSEPRRKLDSQYDTALKATLEAFGWRFARKRVQLALDSSSPDFGFEYQFQLPSDCIRILYPWNGTNEPEDIIWEQEEDKILTDEDEFYIVYTFKVENEGKFTPLFAETLEFKLASLVAMPLKQDKNLATDNANKFAANLILAETQDAKRRSRRKTKQRSSWLTARGASTQIEPAQVI